MPQVQLPPGCKSLAFADGTRAVAAREGGYVNVSDRHARDIDAMSGNGDAGLLTGRFRVFGGTRTGRVCKCSPTIWNAWSVQCPRCGGPTRPE